MATQGTQGRISDLLKFLVPKVGESFVLGHNVESQEVRRPGLVQNWPVRLKRSWNWLVFQQGEIDSIGDRVALAEDPGDFWFRQLQAEPSNRPDHAR